MSYKKTQNNNEKISGVKLMNRRSHLPKRLNFFFNKETDKNSGAEKVNDCDREYIRELRKRGRKIKIRNYDPEDKNVEMTLKSKEKLRCLQSKEIP